MCEIDTCSLIPRLHPPPPPPPQLFCTVQKTNNTVILYTLYTKKAEPGMRLTNGLVNLSLQYCTALHCTPPSLPPPLPSVHQPPRFWCHLLISLPLSLGSPLSLAGWGLGQGGYTRRCCHGNADGSTGADRGDWHGGYDLGRRGADEYSSSRSAVDLIGQLSGGGQGYVL